MVKTVSMVVGANVSKGRVNSTSSRGVATPNRTFRQFDEFGIGIGLTQSM